MPCATTLPATCGRALRWTRKRQRPDDAAAAGRKKLREQLRNQKSVAEARAHADPRGTFQAGPVPQPDAEPGGDVAQARQAAAIGSVATTETPIEAQAHAPKNALKRQAPGQGSGLTAVAGVPSKSQEGPQWCLQVCTFAATRNCCTTAPYCLLYGIVSQVSNSHDVIIAHLKRSLARKRMGGGQTDPWT
jgi:hypothetical protein